MYNEEIQEIAKSAEKKVKFYEKNLLGFILSSILAGIYISITVLFVCIVGGMLNEFHWKKIIVGASFSVALSIIYVAGSDLFTGNSLVMSVGGIQKKVTLGGIIKILVVCYIGNLIGSIIISYFALWGGFINGGETTEFLFKVALGKASITPLQIFIRAILCNIMVCLATWCWYRCKSETARLIMVFWCVFVFFTSGFEHSIANMSIFMMSLLSPVGTELTASMCLTNIGIATIGNIIGAGLFLAVPYCIIAKNKTN